MAGEELTRIIFLERVIQDLLRRLASIESQLSKVAQDSRIAGMSTPFGSTPDSTTGLAWATTNAAISSGGSGDITLLDEGLVSTGTVVSAFNGYSFSIPTSTRVQYRKTATGGYVIVVVNCTP